MQLAICNADTLQELQSRDTEALEQCRALLEQSNAKNAALEEEIATLRAAAAKQPDKTNSDSALPASSLPDNARGPSAAETTQKLEFAKLARRFQILNDNFRKARAALERWRAERDDWKTRCELLQEQIKTAESEHGLDISAHAPAALESLPNPKASFNCSFTSTGDVSEAGGETTEPELPAIRPDIRPEPRSLGDTSIGPSDSTQEGSDAIQQSSATSPPAPVIKNEPSSDGPFITSERPVKRARTHKAELPAPSRARIKLEPTEDSVHVAGQVVTAASQESLDLENVTHIQTPRKPRETPSASAAWTRPNITPFAAENTTTPITNTKTRGTPLSNNVQPDATSSALRPIDANRMSTMRRQGSGKSFSSARKRQLDESIADIAEDGISLRNGQENYIPVSSRATNDAHKNRLDQLLHESGIDQSPSLSKLARQRRNIQTIDTAELIIPSRRELPFEKHARQSSDKTHRAPATPAQPSATSVQGSRQLPTPQTAGNLRRRPLKDLRLDDFRVNPAANDGHDFAYSDVVRDRDDRACLSGCTDLHCCGKQFRALAISQRPDSPLTPAERVEEQKLLEQFLGDNAYRLATMDPDERLETWIQAKTQELANKYGKHRHRYSRMQSPPGFWDADFPSTQELEANREEAAGRERKAIRERYREAIRPGGRWLFKDE